MLCGLLAAPTMTAAAEPVAIAVPGLSSAGEAIARGAHDAMWIAEPADPGAIARVTTAGVVTEFKGGTTHNLSANSDPSGLVASGGALWFALSGGEDLGRITTAGSVTRFGLEGDHRATSLAGGPDGRLWMTVEGDHGDPDAVARINGGNTATPFTSGLSSSSNPRSLIAGTDGALWFVESGGSGRIGRVTTTGVITWTDVGGAPSALAAGPLDSLWYARGASVFRLGDPTPFSAGSAPGALATGPDGALWGTLLGGVARIEPDGTTHVHRTGVPSGARGLGIAAGPDGHMWMTLDRVPYLVRVTVPPRVEGAQAVEGAVTATVTANGLETEVHAELRQPDGSWLSAGSVSAGAGTSALPVSLALRGLTPGRHAARVRATNAAGTATSATVELAVAQPPTDPPTDPPPAPPAPPALTPTPTPTADPVPVQGKTVVLTAGTGTVRIRAPGQSGYTTLDAASNVPVGALIDTTAGSVVLSSRVGGRTQSGTFGGGKFRVRQERGGMTALTLAGELDCRPRATAAASAKPKPRKRRVWGADSGGRFQTHGKSSVATVRGTRWSTEDTCTGTRVRVTQGAVAVKPAGKRAVLVRAGHSIFTRHRR